MHNAKMAPDIELADGTTAYHTTYQSNQGTEYHRISWPKKLRREELDLNATEFAAWVAQNQKVGGK